MPVAGVRYKSHDHNRQGDDYAIANTCHDQSLHVTRPLNYKLNYPRSQLILPIQMSIS